MMTRVLIVKLSSMGDVIHTLPAAQAIRRAMPDAHLAWAIERAHAPLLANQSWLDEVIVWDRRNPRTFLAFIRRLRSARWDVSVDFQGLLRSGLTTYLSGARRRIGFAPTKEHAHWFYNERVPLVMDRHAVERYAQLAKSLDAEVSGLPLERSYLQGKVASTSTNALAAPSQLFPLCPSEQDRADVAAWLARRRFDSGRERLVVLNPHCRKDANRWPAVRYTMLAQQLLASGDVRVALAGGPVAAALCDVIAAPLGDRVWRADGQLSLLGTAELFARADVVVTGDTGPMHIAAAVETPIVALFGPADPMRTGPYTANAIVINKHLECSPCFARRCPLGHEPPLCMQQIEVDEVLRAVIAQLAPSDAADRARRSA